MGKEVQIITRIRASGIITCNRCRQGGILIEVMAKKTKIGVDLGLSSIKIKQVTIDSNDDYHIYVSCTATDTRCHKCGKKITASHGQCNETIIEHLPILDRRVFIHVKWPRFQCSDCDDNPTTSFRPEWLNDTGELTKAYENYALRFVINSTIKDASEKLGTTEEVIEGIINRNIKTDIDWDQIRPTRMGMDEIALRKGHNQYLTIISDISIAKKTKILAVIKGRTKEDILPFLEKIPREVLLSLEAFSIDMGASYFSALKDVIGDDTHFKRIVTIDRFHVSQLVGDKVDKERKKVIKRLKKEFENDEYQLEQLKYTMWPFRHHPKDLSDEEKNRLESLFDLEPILKQCYQLREDLYKIFELKSISKEEAKEKIDQWCKDAQKYKTKGFNPFTSFIETYRKYEDNILNYFTHRISSGTVEGLNNKIKVIKRRGFGFRNVVNFAKRLFLDINYKHIFLPAT
ncbi:MAG: ISL3 family transposase [Gammaproteobacteria bacterium]|nr:ISL3 family transposase [Gammaproteobacteria bacterium]